MDVKVYRLRALQHERMGKPAAAVADFTVAAERGDTWAQDRLARAWHHGELGLKPAPPRAERWYRIGAALSDPKAQAGLGVLYYEAPAGIDQNLAEAEKWLRMAADTDNPIAQGRLGAMLWAGEGVAQDRSEAFRRLRAGIKKGDAFSRDFLACHCAQVRDALRRVAAPRRDRRSGGRAVRAARGGAAP